MPHLYVAWQAGIHSASSIPRLSKNPRNQGVEPSPTPMTPTTGDSRTVISTPRSMSEPAGAPPANVNAVIQPADPPPTMTMRRTLAGGGDGFLPVSVVQE